MEIDDLSEAYGLSKKVVADRHGCDDQGNFVALINRKKLDRAIQSRNGKSGSFANIVLHNTKKNKQ